MSTFFKIYATVIFAHLLPATGEDKAAVPVTDTEFSQSVNPQNFCTGVSLHHQALIQNSGPLIDMSDIRPGTSEFLRMIFAISFTALKTLNQ